MVHFNERVLNTPVSRASTQVASETALLQPSVRFPRLVSERHPLTISDCVRGSVMLLLTPVAPAHACSVFVNHPHELQRALSDSGVDRPVSTFVLPHDDNGGRNVQRLSHHVESRQHTRRVGVDRSNVPLPCHHSHPVLGFLGLHWRIQPGRHDGQFVEPSD